MTTCWRVSIRNNELFGGTNSSSGGQRFKSLHIGKQMFQSFSSHKEARMFVPVLPPSSFEARGRGCASTIKESTDPDHALPPPSLDHEGPRREVESIGDRSACSSRNHFESEPNVIDSMEVEKTKQAFGISSIWKPVPRNPSGFIRYNRKINPFPCPWCPITFTCLNSSRMKQAFPRIQSFHDDTFSKPLSISAIVIVNFRIRSSSDADDDWQ
jgi:hypothetical protein